MPILTFNNASDAAVPDDVRINSAAVRFVEAARPEQKGRTMIYLLGQGAVGIPVVESPEDVVAAIGGMAAATRYYMAGAPGGNASTVYIAASNVGYLRSSKQVDAAVLERSFHRWIRVAHTRSPAADAIKRR